MQASTLLFATSRPTMRVSCGILPLPSLLVRALTPMQLFGLMEDTGPVPCFPAVCSCGVYGLRSGDGRLLGTAACSPTFSQFADTRCRAKPDGWGAASGNATMKVRSDRRATRPPSALADH